ncbi:MAG: hypothetical protein RIS97_681, partial [Pseudomonadota bacterium]
MNTANLPTNKRPSDIFNNEDSNTSANADFETVLNARLSRRNMLRGGVGAAGAVLLGGAGLAGCASTGQSAMSAGQAGAAMGKQLNALGFAAVPKSLADMVSVPAGYKAEVFYAVGDPLFAGLSAFKNDGTDTDLDKRAGDHHDGMEWFGLD